MERVDYESVIIQDLLGFFERNELNVAPWYQRRSVWKRPQKAYLINTILERKPVPSIYIRHSVDYETEKSIKEVVDGQQRVRCLVEYTKDLFPAKHPNYKAPLLFNELKKSERIFFMQSSLSVGYLIGASDADVIEIFARINSVSKTLNPQEKRNAQFSGEFKQFCTAISVERLPFWRRHNIFTDSQIARMHEVQFVSDLVMNQVEGLQDFSARKLNNYYESHDEEFANKNSVEKRLDRVFSILLDLPEGMLRSSIFSNPQILFSLILVLDSKSSIKREEVINCIESIDNMVESVRSGDNTSAMDASAYSAFTSGNLHRIRSRRLRQQEILAHIQ